MENVAKKFIGLVVVNRDVLFQTAKGVTESQDSETTNQRSLT